MRIAVTGATGTIGSALVRELRARGDAVTALSRDAEAAAAKLGVEAQAWGDPKAEAPPAEALRGRDAVVNLLGERLDQRWSDEAKREIRESRILSTRKLVSALGQLPDAERPRVLVAQSAAGWYGDRGDEPVDEGEPAGSDFLARVVADWEAESRAAEVLGMRVAVLRTGVVLSPDGGALTKMLPFFKLGVGGPVAGGGQYMSWVHVADVTGAIELALDDQQAAGPINVVAPDAPTNTEFSKALGRALHRPAVLPVPGFALRLLYGEMSVTVTASQRLVPKRLTELGYSFRQGELEPALRDAIAS